MRWGLLIVVLVLLVIGGATAAGQPAAVTTPTAGQADSTAQTESDNETVVHRHPDEYAESSDLSAVTAWLEDRLASQLQDGALSISEGEYEQARSYVGPAYRDRLEQYVDVRGDTAEEGDASAEAFESAAENQTRLSTGLERYFELLEDYEAAIEADNETEARIIARDLESLADEILESSTALSADLERIESTTGEDLSEARTATADVRSTVESTQNRIRSEVFVGTMVRLSPVDEPISFSDPLRTTGEIATHSGETVGPMNATIRVDGAAIPTEVGPDGDFTLEYRPIDDRIGTQTLTIEFVPPASSTYLPAESTVTATIEQVSPSIKELSGSETAGFRDPIDLSGRLSVDGVPVDDVQVRTAVGGTDTTTLAVTDGAFGGSVGVPIDVPAGDHELRVALPYVDRALAGTSVSRSVTVRETPTNLTIAEPALEAETIVISGTLEADGDGVGDQSIELAAAGSQETVETNTDGTFQARLERPDTTSVTVTATYDDQQTNLAAADASRTVALPEAGTLVPGSPLLWVGIATLGVIAIAIAWVIRRSPTTPPEPGQPIDEPADPSDSSGSTRAVYELASDQLAAGAPADAIRTAYAGVRIGLGDSIENASAMTHWEFLERYRESVGVNEDLRSITEAYERASYREEAIDTSTARSILELARTIVE